MKSLLLITLACVALSAQAQITIWGKVVDTENNPIPFAHCKLANAQYTGFVADRNGYFSYTSATPTIQVVVTAIGYKSNTVQLSANQENTIKLQPDVVALAGVVVTSVDYERELLQKVLNHIPINYPSQLEQINGTVIEQLAADSLHQKVLYHAKAQIVADKLSYTNKNKFGNVQIVTGEVEMHQPLDSTFVRLMAGVHNVHRFDVIAARKAPFDKINSKHYQFELVDTLSFQNKALFKMSFKMLKNLFFSSYVFCLSFSFFILLQSIKKTQ